MTFSEILEESSGREDQTEMVYGSIYLIDINQACDELECLITNACEFIFTDEYVYDAVEREKICQIINNYRQMIIARCVP